MFFQGDKMLRVLSSEGKEKMLSLRLSLKWLHILSVKNRNNMAEKHKSIKLSSVSIKSFIFNFQNIKTVIKVTE